MFGESLGDVFGPLLIFCFYRFLGVTGVFCILAIVSFCIWMSCAIVMALDAEKNSESLNIDTTEITNDEGYNSFVKSLLYNQLPLRAFINRRAIQSSFTLFIS